MKYIGSVNETNDGYLRVPVVKPRMTRSRKHKLGKQMKDLAIFSAVLIAVVAILRTFFIDVMYVPSVSMDPTLPVGTRLFFLKDVGQYLDVELSDWWGLSIVIILICVVIAETFITFRRRGRHTKYMGRLIIAFFVCLSLSTLAVIPHHSAIDRQRANIGNVVIFEDRNGWLTEEEGGYLVKRIIAVGGQHVVGTPKGITVDGKELDESYLPSDVLPTQKDFDVTVPEGKIWVMGDNRGLSEDSRAHHGDSAFVDRSAIVGIPFATMTMPWDKTE